MDEPKFSIVTEPGGRLMRITMRGFWTPQIVAEYDDAVRAAGQKMVEAGCPVSEFLVLVDARALGAQAQQTLTDHHARFSAPERLPRRNATLVASALFRRQAERLALPNQRIFDDEADAMHWLRHGD